MAGGRSRYEVVSQVMFNNLPKGLTSKRIIDLALLINGIPVAHIEEKDEHLQNQWHTFEQLKGYHGDGLYEGLFAFVQVQFILSQHSAHYFARPNAFEHYNKTFVLAGVMKEIKILQMLLNLLTKSWGFLHYIG